MKSAPRRGERTPDPLVSVVIPTRNRSGLLRSSLRSALLQQGVPFEVIVVDDGSDDDTADTVTRVGDHRIRLLQNEAPRGVSLARNRGLHEARGRWVAFLDDDDLWAPHKLVHQVRAAEETGRAWVYTGSVNITIDDHIVGGGPPATPDELVRRLPERNLVPGGTSGVLASRAALERVGGFDPTLQTMADWDLWLRLAATGPPACVPHPLVAYRVHGSNMSLDGVLVEHEFAVIAARNPRANRAVLYRYLGWWSLRIRRRRTALRYFMRAVARRDPSYGLGAFLADVTYLLRATAEDLRVRYASGVLRSPLNRKKPEHPSWRAEASTWVAAVSGSKVTGGRP